MQNVIALLSGSRQARVIDAVAALDAALKTGSIYNVELTDAKDALVRALDVVKELWQTEYLAAYKNDQTGDVEQDIYYWNPVLTNLPGLHKKVAKHSNLPLVASFIKLTAEFLPYAEAIKGKKFEVIKGRKPSTEPAKEVDLSNTGICAICGRRHKLTKAGKLVDHGFQISDAHGYIGFRSGSCFGVDFLPFEVSTEANVAFDAALDKWIAAESDKLGRLERGEVESFKSQDQVRNEAGRWVKVDVEVTKVSDAKKFAALLAQAVRRSQDEIKAMNVAKVENKAKMDAWKPTALVS